MAKIKPTVLAFVPCLRAGYDKRTDSLSIDSPFWKMNVPRFPFIPPELWAYVCVTDLRGPVKLTVHVFRPDPSSLDGVEIAVSEPHDPGVNDPFQPAQFVARLSTVQFDRSGDFEFSLRADGEELLKRRIRVASVKA